MFILYMCITRVKEALNLKEHRRIHCRGWREKREGEMMY